MRLVVLLLCLRHGGGMQAKRSLQGKQELKKDANVLIMTTAALPWFTGTAINPLLRSAHLSMSGRRVTLYVPWVDLEKQEGIYPKGIRFADRAEQALYIFNWLAQEADLPQAAELVQIAFYDAHLHKPHNSLYPMGETVEVVEKLTRYSYLHNKTVNVLQEDHHHLDLVVLEEPEHLNWYAYRNGKKSAWRRFPLVIGIIHTNYVVYARTERVMPGFLGLLVHPIVGPLKGLATLGIARWMCAAHTHAIIRLSHTLPKLAAPLDTVSNVHGVRSTFLDIGNAKASTSRFYDPSLQKKIQRENVDMLPYQHQGMTSGAYFIGKMLWQKGLDDLGHLLYKLQESYGGRLPSTFDIIGDGPHLASISRKFSKLDLDVAFRGRLDHAVAAPSYRVLINPSRTEVLCTTVAEALAMGKWVILPDHPSNVFFQQFPTCLIYKNFKQFLRAYSHALHHEPPPLSRYLRHTLSWQAATQRFCQLATPSQDTGIKPIHRLAAAAHCHIGRGMLGDFVRTAAGGGFYLGFQSRYVAKQTKHLEAKKMPSSNSPESISMHEDHENMSHEQEAEDTSSPEDSLPASAPLLSQQSTRA